MRLTAAAALASIPLWVVLLFSERLAILIAVNVALYALALMWVGPATADVHDIAGPHLRGLAIGIFFSIVNIVAYGIGAPIIGRASDVLGLRAAMLVCPLACAAGALCLWQGERASRPQSPSVSLGE